MRFGTAALVASQVALTAACSVMCQPGCALERTYVDRVRYETVDCRYRGQEVEVFVPLTSCDEAQHAFFFGQCSAVGGSDSRAKCARWGFCGRAVLVKEPKFSCNCDLQRQCASDAQCPVGEFCRARQTLDGKCAEEGKRECVPFAAEGEECGGERLPCWETRCGGGLMCKGDGLAVDRPGKCELVPTCRALPSCPVGYEESTKCSRDDFHFERCKKETLCGVTIACRPVIVMGPIM